MTLFLFLLWNQEGTTFVTKSLKLLDRLKKICKAIIEIKYIVKIACVCMKSSDLYTTWVSLPGSEIAGRWTDFYFSTDTGRSWPTFNISLQRQKITQLLFRHVILYIQYIKGWKPRNLNFNCVSFVLFCGRAMTWFPQNALILTGTNFPNIQ